MKEIKIRSFPEDAKNTGSLPVVRSRMIDAAPSTDVRGIYPVNILADSLHPVNFSLELKKCEVRDTYIYAEFVFPGEERAFYFRNGQMLGVKYVHKDKMCFVSLPVLSVSGEKVLRTAFTCGYDTTAYEYFSETGEKSFTGVSFEGHMSFNALRDKNNIAVLSDDTILACAVSLVNGIRKDYPDRNISLFYKCDNDEFADFIKAFMQDNCSRFAAAPSLPSGEDVTLFLCGTKEFTDSSAFTQGKVFHNIRIHSWDKVKEYKSEKQHRCKVIFRGETYEITCREGERLSDAFLGAGIPSEIRCSDGECGYCRCRLLDGEVSSLTSEDKRTAADRIYGYIHPCSVTPVSDITVEV